MNTIIIALINQVRQRKSRPNKERNVRIFRTDDTLLMQCPDGSYVLTTHFQWNPESTLRVLRQLCRDVYDILLWKE